MNKLIESSLQRITASEFILDKEQAPKSLEVRQAVLLFTNFAGAANKFGNTSKNFNVVITEELKDIFEAEAKRGGLNVNVHTYGKGEDEPVLYYINVKVNMNISYPPRLTLYTDYKGQKSKTSLTDDTMGCLDRIDIDRADCKINIKESNARPGWAVFYLEQLNVIQIKTPMFGGAYEDWDDPLEEENPDTVE